MSYKAMHHPKESEWFEEDIRKVCAESLPNVDVWTGGFPCQDVSMAGERKGLYGERTGLFFEFVRLLRERGDNKPRWIILENVKGIFSSSGGRDFAIVLYELAALGYSIEYALVNSKDFGVPQSRERVYIIGDIVMGQKEWQKKECGKNIKKAGDVGIARDYKKKQKRIDILGGRGKRGKQEQKRKVKKIRRIF